MDHRWTRMVAWCLLASCQSLRADDPQPPGTDLKPPSSGVELGIAKLLENREALLMLQQLQYTVQVRSGLSPDGKAQNSRITFDGMRYRQERYGTSELGQWVTSKPDLVATFDGAETHFWLPEEDQLGVGHRHVESPWTLYDDLFYRGKTKSGMNDYRADNFLQRQCEEITESVVEEFDSHSCRVITRTWDDGRVIYQWLSEEMSGFPLRTEIIGPSGSVLALLEVKEYKKIDLDGHSYAFPLRIERDAAPMKALGGGTSVTIVDPNTLSVNEPFPDSLFRLDEIHASKRLDSDTGIMTDTRTGKMFDAGGNEIGVDPIPEKVPLTAPASRSLSRRWFFVANVLVVLAFAGYWGWKQWGKVSSSLRS